LNSASHSYLHPPFPWLCVFPSLTFSAYHLLCRVSYWVQPLQLQIPSALKWVWFSVSCPSPSIQLLRPNTLLGYFGSFHLANLRRLFTTSSSVWACIHINDINI
jgi:hypothetical protein